MILYLWNEGPLFLYDEFSHLQEETNQNCARYYFLTQKLRNNWCLSPPLWHKLHNFASHTVAALLARCFSKRARPYYLPPLFSCGSLTRTQKKSYAFLQKIENNKNNTLLRWGAIINAVYTSCSWKKALHSSLTFLVFPTCCRSEEALFVLR